MRKITFNISMSSGVPRQIEGWVTPLSPYLVVHELIPKQGPGWTVTHLLSGMNATAGHKVGSPEEAVKLVEDLVATGIDWSEPNPNPEMHRLMGTSQVIELIERLDRLDTFWTFFENPTRQINEVAVGEES